MLAYIMQTFCFLIIAVLTGCVLGKSPDSRIQHVMIPVPDEPVNPEQPSQRSSLIDTLTRESDQHIINGKITEYGDHPYACNLQYRQEGQWYFTCGAVVYNENTVLTAAHCVDGRPKDAFRVRCGDFHLIHFDEFEQTRTIVKIKMHNKWDFNPRRGFPNDIAVMKVDSPLEFNDYVNTLPIAAYGVRIPKNCQLVGWGVTESGQISYELREVTIKRLSKRQCTKHWGHAINNGHLCFMDKGQPDSSCNGDSGDPAVCGHYLAGVTSWGVKGCGQGHPVVYSRLARYLKWVQKKAF